MKISPIDDSVPAKDGLIIPRINGKNLHQGKEGLGV
jgi:hypothetical protein